MRFRNAFHLLFSNFKSVYRILAYKILVGVVCLALYGVLILPELSEIFNSAEWAALWGDLLELLSAYFPGHATENAFETARAQIVDVSLPAFGQLVWGKATDILWRTICCVIVYIVQRFADTLCYFTVGSILNDRMATYADTPFGRAYVENLGKASKYSLLYVPLAFLVDIVVIALCVLLLSTLNILFAPVACVTTIVLGQTLKLGLTSHWMPAMIADDLPLGKAVNCLTKEERRQSFKVLAVYIALVYVIISVNVIALLTTAGSALLLTVPASYMLLICAQFVNYYTKKGKKYFLTYEAIEKNLSRGDTENFLRYEQVEETKEEAPTDAE